MSRALTSSQSDNDTIDAVTERKSRVAPTRRSRGTRTPEQEAACAQSTRILRSMGLAPAAECR